LREQRELLELKANQAILDLRKTFAADTIAAEQEAKAAAAKQIKELAQRADDEYEQALTFLSEYLDEQRTAVELSHAQGLDSEEEYQRKLLAIEKAGLKQQRVINRDYNKSNAKADKKAADIAINEAQRETDSKKRLKDAEQATADAAIQATLQATDAIIAAFGEESAAGQAALVIKKGIALAEIAMNLERQLAANAVAGAKISAEAPPVTVPIGIAYTIATNALAIAAAIAMVACWRVAELFTAVPTRPVAFVARGPLPT
jgi:hypothetical protein